MPAVQKKRLLRRKALIKQQHNLRAAALRTAMVRTLTMDVAAEITAMAAEVALNLEDSVRSLSFHE